MKGLTTCPPLPGQRKDPAPFGVALWSFSLYTEHRVQLPDYPKSCPVQCLAPQECKTPRRHPLPQTPCILLLCPWHVLSHLCPRTCASFWFPARTSLPTLPGSALLMVETNALLDKQVREQSLLLAGLDPGMFALASFAHSLCHLCSQPSHLPDPLHPMSSSTSLYTLGPTRLESAQFQVYSNDLLETQAQKLLITTQAGRPENVPHS